MVQANKIGRLRYMQRYPAFAVLAFFALIASCTPRDDIAVADTTLRTAGADSGSMVDSTMLRVAVLDPRDEESGIGSRGVPTPQGRRPILRSDTLYADARALADAIGANTIIAEEGDWLRVGDRKVSVRIFRERGGLYVPVRSFGRALGAFTYPERDDAGVRVYPRPVLEWLLANRENPNEVAVLRGALEEGLLP